MSERAVRSNQRESNFKIIGYTMKYATHPGVFAIIFSTMWAFGNVAISKALGWVTDHTIIPTITAGKLTAQTMVDLLWPLFLAAAALSLGIYGRRVFAWTMQYTMQNHYRVMLVKSYLRKSMEWHRNHPKGRLIAYISSDAETGAWICGPLPLAIGTVFLGLFAIGSMAMTDLYLTLIMVTIIPILLYANVLYQRNILGSIKQYQEAKANVSALAQESFDAALMVKTMGKIGTEVDRFDSATKQLRTAAIRVGHITATFNPVYTIVPTVATLIAIFVGVTRIKAGYITPGDLLNMAFLLNLATQPMRVFGIILREVVRSSVASHRIREVVKHDFDTRPGDQPLPRTDQGAAVVLRDVSYAYKSEDEYEEAFTKDDRAETLAENLSEIATTSSLVTVEEIEAANQQLHPTKLQTVEGTAEETVNRHAVFNISLAIEPGQTIALVGRTGSGKSTLVSLIGDLLTPQTGSVLIDGIEVQSLTDEAVASTISFAFQKAFLFNDTIRNNITLYEDTFTDEQIADVISVCQLTETIAGLPNGLATIIGERGMSLSGGQRQRVALARALIRQPRLLILDDATSALDSTIESRILTTMLARQSTAMTTIIVANRMSSILIADHIIFMEDGKITDSGTHDQLVTTNSNYATIVRTYEEEAK